MERAQEKKGHQALPGALITHLQYYDILFDTYA